MSIIHPPAGLPLIVQPPSNIPTDLRHLRYGIPGGDDSKRSPDEIRLIREMVAEDVEAFLSQYNIDTAASREMRGEPPHLQLAIMERGTLQKAINPSGSLVARIREARRGTLGGPMNPRYGGVPALQTLDVNGSELDKFLAINGIDQAAINTLRNESSEVQAAVMAKGPMVNTTNTSASLMARIRNVKNDVAAGINPLLPRSQHPGAAPMGMPMQHPGGMPMQPMQQNPNFLPLPAAPPMGMQPGFLGGAMQPGMAMLPQTILPPPNIVTQQPQPRQIEDSMLLNDAMKAIQKINAPAQTMFNSVASDTAPAAGGGVAAATTPAASSNIADVGDKSLQDEALRCIQAMQDEL